MQNHTEIWSNWSGSVTCTPKATIAPHSIDELSEAIARANQTELPIRVTGTGHSFVPLCEASDGLLISLDNLQGIIAIDSAKQQATVWGGTKIHQLGQPLWEAGLAMANMGDIDRQSIAGAIATGTHGTGPTLGNISTQVVGVRLILPNGEIMDCSAERNEKIYKAAQISLGALGVMAQVTLQLLPAYYLHERTWVEPFEDCMEQLDDWMANNRHCEFFWVPAEDVCALKTLNPTQVTQLPDEATVPNIEGRLARYVREEQIDRSYRIFPSERNIRFNEIEFALPAANGPDCLHEIRQLMQKQYPDVVWPIEYRTLMADDIYLSPAYDQESVTISIHQAHDLPYRPFFDDVEAIFRNHQGRPHWGKIHTHTSVELSELYPMWQTFQKVRTTLDGRGRFMNNYLQDLFES